MTGHSHIANTSAADRRDAGYTLIESMTAAVVLLIISAAILTTVIATAGWYTQARTRTEAYTVANRVMNLILARNSSDIRRPVNGETWPTAIPTSMPWASAIGTFTVDTSLEATKDPATGLSVTRVVVTAYPVGQVLTPAVSVIRFASGWQEMNTGNLQLPVTVQVQLMQDNSAGGLTEMAQSGVRVQLLSTVDLSETRYAVTNSSGIARFESVTEGQYFLSADWRFGTDIRPVRFPQRIYPTHTGLQSEAPVQKYSLLVARHDTPAILSVGAFRNSGFYGQQELAPGVWSWKVDKPYQPLDGLVVYAKPVLNVAGTESSIPGAGPAYPDESLLGPYHATVNAYGIARIEIPYTLDPSVGQYWDIRCTTASQSTGQVMHQMPTLASSVSGGWDTSVNNVDNMLQGDRDRLPQFTGLAGLTPINTSPY